ncbi:MAG: thiamine phosphate synthase [Pseudomonadota bacterium]
MPGIPLNRSTLLRLGGFRAGLPPLVCLTDARRFPDPKPAIRRLPRGSLVIFRHYEMKKKERYALAGEVAALCRARGLRLLVAGDAALALAVRADGLHLPEWLARGPVSRGWAWRRRKPGWLLTAAVHSERALEAAARQRADAALLAPVFSTASHAQAKPLGSVRFASLARRTALPVYALGGIGPTNVRRLMGSGAVGLAAVGAFAKDADTPT